MNLIAREKTICTDTHSDFELHYQAAGCCIHFSGKPMQGREKVCKVSLRVETLKTIDKLHGHNE